MFGEIEPIVELAHTFSKQLIARMQKPLSPPSGTMTDDSCVCACAYVCNTRGYICVCFTYLDIDANSASSDGECVGALFNTFVQRFDKVYTPYCVSRDTSDAFVRHIHIYWFLFCFFCFFQNSNTNNWFEFIISCIN